MRGLHLPNGTQKFEVMYYCPPPPRLCRASNWPRGIGHDPPGDGAGKLSDAVGRRLAPVQPGRHYAAGMAAADCRSPGSIEGQKAGIVPYRQTDAGECEILVITARKRPDSWIFPVGTVEIGESLEQAASRECQEESGYAVHTEALLKTLDLRQKNTIVRFTFFLAQVSGEVDEYETDRQRRWVPLTRLADTIAAVFVPVARAAVARLSD